MINATALMINETRALWSESLARSNQVPGLEKIKVPSGDRSLDRAGRL
jgi:hypothetical protein